MVEKFFWEDFFSMLVADLLLGQDVEELAKSMGKAPNTVQCFGYKSKAQNLPNVKQFAEILEHVMRSNPGAVRAALRKFCARFGVVAGSREEVLRQIAGEIEGRDQGSGARGREPGQMRWPVRGVSSEQ